MSTDRSSLNRAMHELEIEVCTSVIAVPQVRDGVEGRWEAEAKDVHTGRRITSAFGPEEELAMAAVIERVRTTPRSGGSEAIQNRLTQLQAENQALRAELAKSRTAPAPAGEQADAKLPDQDAPRPARGARAPKPGSRNPADFPVPSIKDSKKMDKEFQGGTATDDKDDEGSDEE